MTTEAWHPDIDINDKLAQSLIEAQFPSLAPITQLHCVGEGWDNKVFLVNDHLIFRFPHRKIAGKLIERENPILTWLQTKVDLDIPNPKYIGQPSSLYPYSFHGYHKLRGHSGCHANLTDSERNNSIVPFATFLKQLHSIREELALQIGALPHSTEKLVDTLQQRIKKIIDRKICNLNKDALQKEMSLAQQLAAPVEEKVLVHGDLYCRHLLFDQGQLTGIIDWGDVGIHHSAIDLSVLYSFYPSDCHNTFFDIYGDVSEVILQNARFIGLYNALTIILYGHDMGDEALVKEAIESVKRINPKLL